MTERKSRDILAESLRHLASGVITNDEFENRIPNSKDPAIHGISVEAWSLYSDLHEHTLTGKYKLSKEVKRNVAKCILFLKTDQEYEYPEEQVSILHLLFGIITLGIPYFLWNLYQRIRSNSSEESEVIEHYPFSSMENLEQAKLVHPYQVR